ncbi:helix-turn-helix transcriptional regulator [Pseudoalteromonas sp. MMG005]|uniref:helix-turn-helix domain-containing protein n=1 Tax=Pseudoalteromonas sp. MMG005 TaxID=2822682 RepID=UPI001B39DE64|nr:helix-turn-helix transcriptional regulator [Pseudoalteromonas sp. MMG005]MBQ4844721.1 helix-turn-helix transcriptional regulator [Pseudoalteromonas sp. MMG005]
MLDGKDLKSIRKNAGISQTEMAKKLDCDRKTVINYEQGVCEPKTSQLFRWLNLCKIDLKPLASQIRNFKECIFLLLTIPLMSTDLVSYCYLGIVSLCIVYGVYRKEWNIVHISLFVISLYTLEYTLIDYFYAYTKTLFSSTLITACLHFGFQIAFTLLSFLVFTFRVQISRCISNSGGIKRTPFDNLLVFIYVYTGFILLLSISEYILYNVYKVEFLSFIYNHFEKFIYLGMAAIATTLYSMVICHEKDLKKQISDT